MLSKDECELVRIISVSGRKDITSVKGIEAFPKLRELYCDNTEISFLDLSNNPRLQMVSCANTKVQELDVSGCPLLKQLKFSGCAIGAFTFGENKNTALEYLVCKYQDIDSVEYIENKGEDNERYCVSLKDVIKHIDLSKVSQVKIDGAEGDGINSGYDEKTGIVYCSDEMLTVSYNYNIDMPVELEDMDTQLEVTLHLTIGERPKPISEEESTQLVTEQPQETETVERTGYQLKLETVLDDTLKAKLDEEPGFDSDKGFSWSQQDIIREVYAGQIPGYTVEGWYTAENGGEKITEDMTYGQIYAKQFSGNDIANIPTIYVRYAKTKFEISYNTNGGNSIPVKEGVEWGSSDILPDKNPTRKGYVFAGWKLEGKKVTKNTKLDDENSLYCWGETVTLDAVWTKKNENKGKTFRRYGCTYQILKSSKKSDKKGNKVKLIRVKKKKITLPDKVFYNGKYYKITSIKKKALKKKTVNLNVSKKLKRKYQKMVKRAGGKVKQ